MLRQDPATRMPCNTSSPRRRNSTMRRSTIRENTISLAAGLFLALAGSGAWAFVPAGGNADNSRWLSTASGATGSAGQPITLTWSFVPDGTPVENFNNFDTEPSILIQQFDARFGAGPGGSDLTQRPWFRFFEESLDRISDLAGITYVYEPNDTLTRHGSGSGVLGLRGDLRIGGIFMDGAGGTLAYNYFPSDSGDMALDTGDLNSLFANPSNNFRGLRNVIMHEAIHGLGLAHSTSNNANFLMEAFINVSFDGPQHDDLRGLHWMYGDALESGPNGENTRNETAATASDLGVLTPGLTRSIGTSGNGVRVGANETDFVSISNENDIDFFSFTVEAPVELSASMTPRGATFNQGANNNLFVTTETNDLSLAIFGPGGSTPLASSASGAAGDAETIDGLMLTEPGTYFARVASESSAPGRVTQFYQLDLLAAAVLQGDYDGNGFVNASDYGVWLEQFGQTGPGLSADGNGDLVVDGADYALWRNNLTPAAAIAAVPEPAAGLACLAA
ncbi:MAG: matrixin family metalloprotease, partial [Planctomycetota bacterium]